jgi:DnaK suppressor protein
VSVVNAALNSSNCTVPGSWGPFREMLESHRSACRDEVRQLSEALLQNGPDTVTLARRGSLERTLEQVGQALGRIDAGTYGACVQCGVAIPVERLELRPHAAGCVSCSAAT